MKITPSQTAGYYDGINGLRPSSHTPTLEYLEALKTGRQRRADIERVKDRIRRIK